MPRKLRTYLLDLDAQAEIDVLKKTYGTQNEVIVAALAALRREASAGKSAAVMSAPGTSAARMVDRRPEESAAVKELTVEPFDE